MAGSGKAKYLAGLQSLVQGFTAMDERRRQRLLDNLEREKFEYDKKYNDDILREKVLERRAILGEKARDASEKQRAAFTEQIHKGRIRKNLESGNIQRAERIAFMRGIPLEKNMVDRFAPPDAESPENMTPFKLWLQKNPDGTYEDYVRAGWRPYKESSGGAGGSPTASAPSNLRQETIALAKEIAAEAPTADIEIKRPTRLPGMTPSLLDTRVNVTPKERDYQQFMPEASGYTKASDIKATPEADPYASMTQDDWDAMIAETVDSITDDEDERKAMLLSPRARTLRFLPAEMRMREFLKLRGPAYFIEPEPRR